MATRDRVIDWRTLLLELLVVFVGLFAALQVEQWREGRDLAEAELVYLERLRDDLQAFRDNTEPMLNESQKHWRDGVVHAWRSLEAGRILDDDSLLFEEGLVRVGHLPSPR